MNSSSKLLYIKLIHTLIWVFMVSVIFFILFSGLLNQINTITWICIVLVLLETIVLLLYRWRCPLTIIARKYSNSTRDNFDIFLPNWLARHNKSIFGTLFIIGFLLVLWHTF